MRTTQEARAIFAAHAGVACKAHRAAKPKQCVEKQVGIPVGAWHGMRVHTVHSST